MRSGTWMTSCPEALRILEFEKNRSWDSSLEEGSRFLVSLRQDQLGSTKCAARLLKKLCLSLLMSKNLKLKKVIKRFVPEPKESRQVYRVFRDSLCTFHIFISWSISWTYISYTYIIINVDVCTLTIFTVYRKPLISECSLLKNIIKWNDFCKVNVMTDY